MKQQLLNLVSLVWRWLVLSQFAIWIGGFTFYAAYVVPIGNEVLGSARDQGFVTQQVTHWLNFVCMIALILMTVDSIVWMVRHESFQRFVPFLLTLLIFGMLLGLVWLHQLMDGLLEPAEQIVKDEERFHQLHRGYLWMSTFQWLLAWIWLFWFLSPCSRLGGPEKIVRHTEATT